MTPDFIRLVRKVFTEYKTEIKILNNKIKQLEDELRIAEAKTNNATRLLQISESKRLHLIQQLNKYTY